MESFRLRLTGPILLAVLLLACGFGASPAQAGPEYIFLVIDPATTAGAGIPSSDGFGITSTHSGAGTWHLYAVDDLADSYGIRSFNVKLNPGEGGTVPIVTNRTPVTFWDDDPTFGNGSVSSLGFNDIRQGNVTGICGGQGVLNASVGGLGISASNFQRSTTGQSFAATTNGQWGNYADPFTSGSLGNTGEYRNSLFLAEGTYTGGAPTIDLTTSLADGGTGINYWANADLTRSVTAPLLSSSNPFACPDCVNNHDPFLVTAKLTNPPAPPPPVTVLPNPPAPPTANIPPNTPPFDDPNPPPAPSEVSQETQPPVSSLDPPIIDIGTWTQYVEVGLNNGLIYYLDSTDLSDPASITIMRPDLLVPRWRILQAAMTTNLAENIPQQLFGAVGEDLADYESRESMPMSNMWAVDHDGLNVGRFAFAQANGSSFDSQVLHDAASAPEPAGIFLMMVAQGCFLLVARCRRR